MSQIANLLQEARNHYQAGELRLTGETAQEILNLDPRCAEAWHLIALVLRDDGQPAEALVRANNAVNCASDNITYRLTVVSLLMFQQRYFDAEQAARAVLTQDAGCQEAIRQIGLAISFIGRSEEAHPFLEQAIGFFPQSVELWAHYGECCRKLGFTIEAIDAFRRLSTMNSADTKSIMALGELLIEMGQVEEAVQCFSKAIDITPNENAPFLGASVACQGIGRFDLSVSTAKHVLRRDPANPRAWFELCRLVRDGHYQLEAEEVSRLRALEKNASLNGEGFRQIRFALGYYYESQGDVAQAQRHYSAANSARLRELRIKGATRLVDQLAEFTDSLIETFGPEAFDWARQNSVGQDAMRPIFLVGLPQVGIPAVVKVLKQATSLAAGGPRVDVDYLAWRGASLPLRQQLPASEAFPGWINNRDTVYLNGIATLFQNRTQQTTGSTEGTLDMLTQGATYVGLMALLFPQAKFIHVRRDVRAVSWSRWTANEASDESAAFSSSLPYLAAESHEFDRLMEHWKLQLPSAIHELDVIDLTADPEDTLRNLLAFMGIEWSDAAKAAASEWIAPSSGKSWVAFASQLEDFLAALAPAMAAAV